ncbi:hypothetical protein [Pedobacter terrae]|uniref:hypothetical protein n=1 Tax=Pedobacter terrae TaxID=405671 RepID=UPI002FF80F3F
MAKKIITLCYRKIIDAENTNLWDKYVHQDSYTEFKMQAQLYNRKGQYNTFAELVLNVPAAEKLDFLVSASITGYLQQLKNIIPDVLDNLGKRFLTFENFKFEIINSDINDIRKHKVGVNFFSTPMVWHDTIGDQLLVSRFKENEEKEILTNLFPIQKFVSIYAIQTIE